MKKRVVSILLAVIMVLGMIPAGLTVPQVKAEEAVHESVVVDFKDSAKKASEQPFWADLKNSTGTVGDKLTTKFIGVSSRTAMDAKQIAAYDSLRTYLWENHGWTIDEATTYLKSGSVNKGVWFNANEMNAASDWGITYLSGGFNTGDVKANGSRLNLTVYVEEAGYYAVNMTAYYSSNAGNLMQLTHVASSAVGGAYADILVNGTSVLPEGMTSYPFSGQAGSPKAEWANTTQTDKIGYAYFNAGSNTVTINTTGNYMNGTTSAAMRRNISLMSMELKYIGSEVCRCSDFSYVPHADGTHTAICTNCEAETTETCTFSYTSNKDNTHGAVCAYCKAEIEEDCTDADANGKCDSCGGKLVANALKMKVSVPGVDKQVARGTVQKFEYTDVTSGDNAISIDAVNVRYETDVDGIIEIDTDSHTFKTLKNGDVTVTITASLEDAETTKTVELTVADVGEDRFLYTDPTFEADNAYLHWPTNGNGFNILTVEDDGSGSNKALKIRTNPGANYTTNKTDSTIIMKNGRLAEVLPGHMYEMTAKVKVEHYKKADGAVGDLNLGFQMFDYKTNAVITANYLGQINGNIGDVTVHEHDWEEVRFVVKAPLAADGPVYITPRIVLRPAGSVDYDISGWEATIWFDDFCIREVGFDGVELELDNNLKSTAKETNVIIKPYTTSGDYINLAAASYEGNVSFTSANEDVVKIVSAPVRTRYTATSQEYFPKAKVQRLDTENETELVAAISLYGMTREARLDVPKVDMSEVVLESMSVSVPGVDKQVARDTLQKFEYEFLDTDGGSIPVPAMAVSYEADKEGILEFDAQNHTFRTLANGDVTVTITASLNGKSLTETVELTVADLGEERFIYTDPTFESEGLLSHWATYADYGDKRFNITTIEDDGTGNKALKVSVNPNASMSDVSNRASVITMANGYFAEVLPGHMYEMSFRVKTVDYVRPEDAMGDLGFDCQMFDYANQNAQVGDNLLLQINGVNNGLPLDMGEWTEIKYVVKAPLTADGPVYMMPRVVLRPSEEADYGLSGWQLNAWFDDFSVREVGFGHVELEVDAMPNDTATVANVFIKSFTSNGDIIDVIADRVGDAVKFYSTNDDVVTVTSAPERLVYNSANREYHPKAGFRLVGLNAPAELVAEVTLCGITREARMDMTKTDMPEELRDIYYTLDGFEALVLKNGDVVKGAMTGRTTQLNPLTEEQLKEGARYFVSSNPKVAVVDQATGDVTCIGEGSATITAYVLLDGVTASDCVELTVTDDTDLASIEIAAAVDYIGVNNTVQLTVTGKKASGGAADMSLYPMAWTVDDEALAAVSDGKVTALTPGTVTVTATVGVEGQAVSDTITFNIVPNSELAGSDIVLNFTNGHLMNIHECTFEKDGVEINRGKTYNNGVDAKTIHKYGFGFNVPAGEQLAIDFTVERDGWYRVEAGGGLFSSGNISSVYVDDYYAGDIDFFAGISGQPYMASMIGNTVYLEAGRHTFYIVAVTDGLQFLGRLTLRASHDPDPISVEVSAPKEAILVGETMDLIIKATDADGRAFYLKHQAEEPAIVNYYQTEAVTDAASVSGSTVTGEKAGSAMIDVVTSANGQMVYHTVEFKVNEGTVASAALNGEKTTFAPGGGSAQLDIVCYNTAGKKMEAPDDLEVSYETSDAAIATVSADGTVTAGTKEGSAKITATITEGSHVIEASVWITVTIGKTEPTLYTYEERANAQENALKYTWAWDTKEAAVKEAEFVIENFDAYYLGLGREGGIPRTSAMYHEGYNGTKDCDYCGMPIEQLFGVNCWITDPVNKPWKVTCPYCKKDFPSNDFESYYKSGLDERGYFDAERADKSLLVNTTFPDRPADWGVDDGSGWLTGDKDSGGKPDVYNYIAYYSHMRFEPRGKAANGLLDGMEALAHAYLYTGEEKYGTYGAILLTRVAEIYPEYSMVESSPSGTYVNSDGGSGRGKFVGAIWEATMVGQKLAKASDALWPAMNHDGVIEYLKTDAVFYGVDPEAFTPEYLREKVDNGILLQIRDAVLSTDAAGNFGMEQGAMALAAVALDRLPETEEMLDWTFRYGQRLSSPTAHATGGNVYYNVVNLVDRNGFGNEVSYTYNRQWYTNLMSVADALAGYTRVEGADLWKFPKFVEMFRAYGRMVQGGHAIVQFGEAGGVQSTTTIINLDVQSYFVPAFQNTNDPFIAQMIYAGNGNKVDGLHADIFTEDPEEGFKSKIKSAINNHGELDMGASSQLAGFGVTNLRTGPAKFLGKQINGDEYFNTAIYYGTTDASHSHLEALSLNIFAYGLSMSANLGYPTVVSANNFETTQWVRNTISHNLVLVNDEQQTSATYGGYPLHYDDAEQVQLVDVDASNAYPETDIYRRTVVMVKAPNGVPYNVDFFRVLGGKEHVYSFHANTTKDPATEGLDFLYQPMGSYAGAGVPYGPQYHHPTSTDGSYNQGNGYSWLKEVYRDAEPEANFTVDWEIEDFHSQLATSRGLHMKLTMMSDDPMNEVALADGIPPQNGTNPEKLKYMLVRRSGENGMDTLFTSVIETYLINDQIASSELVDVTLVEGTESVTDKAAAIKVTMTDGRVDYIVYATNTDCLYEVDDKFVFSGFVGVCSYYDDVLVYAYGNEATQVADVVESDVPAVTGKVIDFTEGLSLDGYSITVSLDQEVTEADFAGRCIYVENDKQRNAVYQIVSAEVYDDVAVLNIGHETLVRGYIDGNDLDAGFIYNIEAGAGYTIPLSDSFDTTAILNHTTDQVIKHGNKVTLNVGVAGSGMVYELDGLATGMKFDAKLGQITWNTSATQIGRYPITVKAVDVEGDVVGSVSFVIYLVKYTGASYDASVCTHAKAVTYNVDGVIETVCPACGTITKTELTEKFDVAGSNMTLGNELRMNYLVKTSDLGSGTYTAKITHNDETTEETFVKYNSTYHYVSYTVTAAQMADEITVEVFDENGNAVSNVYTTSVRTYAMNLLGRSTTNAKTKTLLVDMLNYGAAAQENFKYNTSDLANAKLTDAQQALATAAVTCTDGRVKGENYYGSNLSLEEKILLNVYFKNVASDMYAEISFRAFDGTKKTIEVPFAEFKQLSGSTYAVVVDDIVLAEVFNLVTVTVYNADGTVHGTATDSVESYIARSSENALNEAIMKFAVSAKIYYS